MLKEIVIKTTPSGVLVLELGGYTGFRINRGGSFVEEWGFFHADAAERRGEKLLAYLRAGDQAKARAACAEIREILDSTEIPLGDPDASMLARVDRLIRTAHPDEVGS